MWWSCHHCHSLFSHLFSKTGQWCLRKRLGWRVDLLAPTNTGFPTKWRLRNDRRNTILMTRHYPGLGSASDLSCRVGNLIQPIRSTTQIWVVMQWCVIGMEWKPVVALPNVGCFLRLILHAHTSFFLAQVMTGLQAFSRKAEKDRSI